jgi:chromosome segregation ATPase
VSEEITQNLPDKRSFEERVFARFDAIDARLNSMDARFDAIDERLNVMDARFDAIDERLNRMDARLDGMDARLNDMDSRLQALEQKSYDTKPIWERALALILAVSEKLDKVSERLETVERKFDVLSLDMMTLRGDQRRIEARMDKLDLKPAT